MQDIGIKGISFRWILTVLVLLLSLTHPCPAQQSAATGNNPIRIEVSEADPRETSYLRLVNGIINGQSISPQNRTVTVDAGASISGQFTVQINSTFSPNAAMAMGLTPNWGTHAVSFVPLPGFTNPITDQTRNITVSLTAPSTPGTYYIIIAFNTENTAAQVMSCTNWLVSNPVWGNGDDVADWTPTTIAEANANGRALVNYLFPSPIGNQRIKIPATALSVSVISPIPTTSTTFSDSSTTTTTSVSATTSSTTWWSSTTSTTLIAGLLRGALDYPYKNLIVSGTISIGGWAAVVSGNQAGITSRVELWVDGSIVTQLDRGLARADVQQYLAGQGISAPDNLGFSGLWDSRTVIDGSHLISIQAADAAGMSRESTRVIASVSFFTYNNLLTTSTSSSVGTTTTTYFLQGSLRGSLENPSNNAVVSGDVSISGWAAVVSGKQAGIAGRIELLVDGLLVGQLERGFIRLDVQQYLVGQGITAPNNLGFSGQWDSRSVADGSHLVCIRGADAAGMSRESVGEIASINIITSNNLVTTTTTSLFTTTTTTLPISSSRVIRLVCGMASLGSTLTVPIELVSQGDENALGFSLTFDPTILSNPQATWGSDASNALFTTNAEQATQGRFGIALSLPANTRFEAGIRQIAVVNFNVAPSTSATTTFLSFGNSPIVRQVSNVDAQTVSATFQGCNTISITQGYEADVTPRPTGKNNGTITISDWVQVCRFSTNLDIPAPGGEFQRADCAPRQNLGDGLITITDCVQTGRYANGQDPVTLVGGPTVPATPTALGATPDVGVEMNAVGQRVLRAAHATFQRGQRGSLSVELDSQGDENALGFNLHFDPSLLSYDSVALGDGASGAMLMINTHQLGSGQLGIALALPAGQRFVAGTQQLVTVRFHAAAGSTAATTQVRFGDQPIHRQVSDHDAKTLPVSYTNGTITFSGESLLTLYFPQVVDGAGYSTSFILGNPLDSDTTAQLDFFADDGSPLNLPIGGTSTSTWTISLSARGVTRVTTDGTSAGIKVGWLKVTCPMAIGGKAILQVLSAGQIISEASIASSLPAAHLMTYVQGSEAATTGLAISNPNNAPVTVSLKLRTVQGAVVATASLNLPALGHISQFVTRWFGSRFAEFEGSLEVLATGPISGVALRYDNAMADVFTTLPLIVIP